jgi:hypothetical protein
MDAVPRISFVDDVGLGASDFDAGAQVLAVHDDSEARRFNRRGTAQRNRVGERAVCIAGEAERDHAIR